MAYLDTNGLNTFWTKLKGRFQDKLVSGTNIKTINNESILGSGNISVGGGGGGATVFEIIPVNFSYDIDELEEHRRRIYLTDSTTSRPLTISGYEIDDDYGHNAVRLQGWNIYEEDGVYFLHCRLYNDGFNAMPESGIITIYVLYASTPDTYDGEVE